MSIVRDPQALWNSSLPSAVRGLDWMVREALFPG